MVGGGCYWLQFPWCPLGGAAELARFQWAPGGEWPSSQWRHFRFRSRFHFRSRCFHFRFRSRPPSCLHPGNCAGCTRPTAAANHRSAPRRCLIGSSQCPPPPRRRPPVAPSSSGRCQRPHEMIRCAAPPTGGFRSPLRPPPSCSLFPWGGPQTPTARFFGASRAVWPQTPRHLVGPQRGQEPREPLRRFRSHPVSWRRCGHTGAARGRGRKSPPLWGGRGRKWRRPIGPRRAGCRRGRREPRGPIGTRRWPKGAGPKTGPGWAGLLPVRAPPSLCSPSILSSPRSLLLRLLFLRLLPSPPPHLSPPRPFPLLWVGGGFHDGGGGGAVVVPPPPFSCRAARCWVSAPRSFVWPIPSSGPTSAPLIGGGAAAFGGGGGARRKKRKKRRKNKGGGGGWGGKG